jgi:integrase
MSVYLTKKGWRVDFTFEKQRVTKGHFQTKREAKEEESKIRKRLKEERRKTPTDTAFLTLANKYLDYAEKRFVNKTYLEKAQVLKRLMKEWGSEIDIMDITPEKCIDYLTKRADETSNNAYNKDRKNLHAFFTWTSKILRVQHNPITFIDRLPESRSPRYIPSPSDFDKVLLCSSGQDRVMLQTFYHTLGRRGEIFNLTWEDVNFEQRWVRLWTRKRLHSDRQADYIPMNDTLYNALKWQFDNRFKNSQYVFVNRDENSKSYGMKFTTRRKFMRGLCKRAEVKEFGFHSIRHMVASILNDTHKVSKKKIQKILRHQSQRTTEIYLHALETDLTDTMKLLEEENRLSEAENL